MIIALTTGDVNAGAMLFSLAVVLALAWIVEWFINL